MTEEEEKQQDKEEGDSSARIKIRIESLSDLVFGLALSIGSIGFLSSPAHSASDLEFNIAEFAFSFIILVFTWLGYSRTVAVLSRENDAFLYVNIVLLFLVAVEPYLFFVLVTTSHDLTETFSIAYGLDVGAMFLIQGALAQLVLIEDKKNVKLGRKHLHPQITARFRRTVVAEVIVGVLFLISLLPIFWEINTPIGPARFLFWYSPFVIVFLIRGARIMKPKKSTTPQVVP
ncbi:MAG TPA: TMEM175 family protein [Nitrososphaerales archaeon]|nr:TMEM175 family protein [Nitrososphaerales archaeon]